jgi:hypothetical protein
MKFYAVIQEHHKRPPRLHLDPDCDYLHAKRKAPVTELVDPPVRVTRLCKICCKGQVYSAHLRCRICNKKDVRPCPHNGGVLVEGERRWHWVWPEDAFGRTLVDPLQVR